MMNIQQLGEFGLIERMHAALGTVADDRVVMGISDDAAVYRVSEGRVHVLTTDALLEGVHFDRSFMPMSYLGQKSIAVNVSDVVAMNATPRYATITLGLPQNAAVELVDGLYEGLARAGAHYGVSIIGGDTTASQRLMISVTLVGEADEDAIVYRSGARPGDLVCVTGDLGSAYAGLKILLEERKALQTHGDSFQPDFSPYTYVIQRQLMPAGRVDVIEAWKRAGVRPNALIDVSDGLASEVNHLCLRSDCGALIHGASLPVDLQTRAVADRFGEDVDTYALFGGEDYELLFAMSEKDIDRLSEVRFSVIGRFTEAHEGVRIQTPEGPIVQLEAAGFDHFRS